MSEDTRLKELIINTLSPEQMPEVLSETEIYLVEDDVEYATVEELATKQDLLPTGTTGYVLTKTDSGVDWQPSSGGDDKMNIDFSNATNLAEINPMIESYVNGTDGYNIWANGYCEQWGRLTRTATGVLPISFTKKFKDTGYSRTVSIDAIDSYTASMNSYNAYTLQCNVDGMSIACPTAIANLNGVCWKVCGYLAEGEY